ncbi:GtrA family protein [Enterobacter quasiroggenkampii]|uniref:GtrA family protein n=1 Tax=Enterobacter quasiroggenkampii TaxID=2497436 RepID=UPI00398BA803
MNLKAFDRIFVFFNIGVIQFFVDTALLQLFVLVDVKVTYANILSRALAACLGCYLNYRYTFKYQRGLEVRYLIKVYFRFAFFWVFMTLLSNLMLMVFLKFISLNISFLPLHTLIAKIATETLLFVISFFISKFWVFNNGK